MMNTVNFRFSSVLLLAIGLAALPPIVPAIAAPTSRPATGPSTKPARGPGAVLKLGEVNSGQALDDFRAAVRREDYHFIGLLGFGLYVPGVRDFRGQYGDRFKVMVIEGTSDFIKSDKQEREQNYAVEYAVAYNHLMLGFFEAKGIRAAGEK